MPWPVNDVAVVENPKSLAQKLQLPSIAKTTSKTMSNPRQSITNYFPSMRRARPSNASYWPNALSQVQATTFNTIEKLTEIEEKYDNGNVVRTQTVDIMTYTNEMVMEQSPYFASNHQWPSLPLERFQAPVKKQMPRSEDDSGCSRTVVSPHVPSIYDFGDIGQLSAEPATNYFNTGHQRNLQPAAKKFVSMEDVRGQNSTVTRASIADYTRNRCKELQRTRSIEHFASPNATQTPISEKIRVLDANQGLAGFVPAKSVLGCSTIPTNSVIDSSASKLLIPSGSVDRQHVVAPDIFISIPFLPIDRSKSLGDLSSFPLDDGFDFLSDDDQFDDTKKTIQSPTRSVVSNFFDVDANDDGDLQSPPQLFTRSVRQRIMTASKSMNDLSTEFAQRPILPSTRGTNAPTPGITLYPQVGCSQLAASTPTNEPIPFFSERPNRQSSSYNIDNILARHNAKQFNLGQYHPSFNDEAQPFESIQPNEMRRPQARVTQTVAKRNTEEILAKMRDRWMQHCLARLNDPNDTAYQTDHYQKDHVRYVVLKMTPPCLPNAPEV